jgi:hypothetical protein
MSHNYDDVTHLSDADLDKEVYFAEQAQIPGDSLTEGWLKHLRTERQSRGSTYQYVVTVRTDTREHADEVMDQLLGQDDDYGFDYKIRYFGGRQVKS